MNRGDVRDKKPVFAIRQVSSPSLLFTGGAG